MYLWEYRGARGGRGELFPFSCVGAGCLIEVLPLPIISEEKYGRITELCNDYTSPFAHAGKREGTVITLALLYGPSALRERAEGKRSQSPTTSQFPNYNKVCFSPCQTEAERCMNMWKESFSMHGHSNPSHQTILNCSRSSLQLFCSLASLRAITEGSRSGSVGQILLICLQTKRLLHRENIPFPIRVYSIPHTCKRQNEKQ